MNKRSWVPVSVGVLAGLIGIIGIVNREVGIRLLGGGALLNLIGIAALGLAVRALWQRVRTERKTATLPDVGSQQGTQLAGGDFDEALSAGQDVVRERIRAVVDQITTEEESDTVRDEAGNGTPLPDPLIQFLQPTRRDGLWVRLRERLREKPLVVRQATAAIDALGEMSAIEWEDSDPGPQRPDPQDALDRLEPGDRLTRTTGRFRGAEVVPLVAIAVGIATRRPGPLMVAAATSLLLGVVRSRTAPELSLDIEHRLTDRRPRPGERVRVTLSVTNEGECRLPDLRVAAGVPPGLAVTAGRPVLGATLPPGETATTTFEITASCGTHEFQSVPVISRDSAGRTETVASLESDTMLECIPTLAAATGVTTPQSTTYAGQADTRTGGAGVEFFGTRSYRHGDSLSRIDWNRLARTGEMTTVQYREERAVSVVIIVDTRPAAYVGPRRDGTHAVARSIEAAAALAAGRLDEGDRVGLAALGGAACWVPPGTGSAHRARLRDTLGTHPAFAPTPPEDPFDAAASVASLRARLPANATLVFLTPLVDEWPVSVLRRLRGAGYEGLFVSPDPTCGATPGARLTRIERSLRINRVRRAGTTVADWGRGESLAVALSRLSRR